MGRAKLSGGHVDNSKRVVIMPITGAEGLKMSGDVQRVIHMYCGFDNLREAIKTPHALCDHQNHHIYGYNRRIADCPTCISVFNSMRGGNTKAKRRPTGTRD